MTKLYLDLEETIIKSFHNPLLVNVGKIKHFIETNPDVDRKDVRIFSFALYNAADQQEFDSYMRPAIERAIGVVITEWLSIEQIARASQKLTGVTWQGSTSWSNLDASEFINIKGKVGAFQDVVFQTGSEGERYVLIDDVVPRRTLIDYGRNIQIDWINVVRDL